MKDERRQSRRDAVGLILKSVGRGHTRAQKIRSFRKRFPVRISLVVRSWRPDMRQGIAITGTKCSEILLGLP
jgi:hypothetical protein